jgi:hypothetical protein
MALNMKGNGALIKRMEKENFGTLMEMFMKDSGLMTKPMATGSTSM